MSMIGIVTIFLYAVIYLPSIDCQAIFEINDRPIIGILTQEISYHLDRKYPGMYKSYVAASYVKFVESAGARVVPIWIDQNRFYYKNIMSQINGVLFPGGATWFNQSNGYADAGRYIYDIATEMNDRGDYFPLWGTCLGFELLTYLSSRSQEHRAHCNSQDQAIPLNFTFDYRDSRLYSSADSKVLSILRREPVTINYHQFCVTRENLTKFDLDTKWRVMSVNHDTNGLEFISSVEHKHYPFYGIQFHPEKNAFEWKNTKNIPHTTNSIIANWYFGLFFINEARKNSHSFKNVTEEVNCLIYNYQPIYTARVGSSFTQSYLFDSGEHMCTKFNRKK